MAASRTPPPAPARPVGLVVIGVVLLLEALAVAVLGVLFALVALGTPSPVSGVAAGLTLLLTAALLVGVAVGTFRARPWTRSASLVWEVVQLLVGLYAFQGAGPAVAFAVAAIAPAVVVIALLFTPPVREATARLAR